MKIGSTLLIFVLIIGPGVLHGARSSENSQGANNSRRRQCNEDCSSSSQRPVCGTDDRTYSSRCELQLTKCQQGTSELKVKHKGPCRELSTCEKENLQAQEMLNQPMVGVFVPECNEEGGYAEVQCHNPTGYCWCVTTEGKPIPGSSLRYQQPKCRQHQTEAEDIDPDSNRRGCSPTSRSEFNRNLIDLFAVEYNREVGTEDSSTGDTLLLDAALAASALNNASSMTNADRMIVDWKFSQLDSNEDLELDRRELRLIKRMVKRMVEPKKCSKTFTTYCDLDQDERIAQSEWTVCLGVDMNRKVNCMLSESFTPSCLKQGDDSKGEESEGDGVDEAATGINIYDDGSRGPTLWDRQMLNEASEVEDASVREELDCDTERLKAIEEQALNDEAEVFVPQCADDGLFQQVQCHDSTGYCWCVGQDTGRPIPGTSTRNELPNCDPTDGQSPTPSREFPECDGDKKVRFLISLLDEFIAEMVENLNNGNGEFEEPDPNTSLEERAAQWVYRGLDENENERLDRKEKRNLRNMIKDHIKPKKCARNFADYCDANTDDRISWDEWMDCLGLHRGTERGSIQALRQGVNPFSEYLH